MKKIMQTELAQIIAQHQLWLDSDGDKGERADLQGADLRGAYLVDAYLIDADLRGARFSTNIRDCSSFSYAKFTPDTLPWLILHPGWPKWKDTVQIETE